jgi:hypothetical protein
MVPSFASVPFDAWFRLHACWIAGKAATYTVDGMTFQFPTDNEGNPSAAEADLKREGHYMKSLIALLSSGVDRVALPMTCLVNHLVWLFACM